MPKSSKNESKSKAAESTMFTSDVRAQTAKQKQKHTMVQYMFKNYI